MIAKRLASAVVLALVAASFGCSRHAFSPPARALPIETPQTLEPGQTSVQGEASSNGALFGPDVAVGTARVRHGVAEDVDVTGEATVMHVSGSGGEGVSTNPNIYSARVGVKHRLSSWFAVGAGLGGGGSAGGGFLSPDLTVMAGWENRYVIPFLALRGFTSHPIGASTVYLGDSVYDRPRLTLGFAWALGLRVPLLHAKTPGGVAPVSAGIAVGSSYLFDGKSNEGFAGLATSLEIVL